MTINDMFQSFRRQCESLAQESGQYSVYMSTADSKQKRAKFEKLISKYKEDVDIDSELGVLTKDETDIKLRAYEIMKRSMAA